MDLDRGFLARLDRKLLAGLGQDETFHMVRVPVTEAKWSTWKRYCDSAGISMGRAVVTLIDRELARVLGDTGHEASAFARRADEDLASREAAVAARERELKLVEGEHAVQARTFAAGKPGSKPGNGRLSWR